MTGQRRIPMLKACLNGARRPGDHEALPLAPAELAADASRVAALGAGAVHMHPRRRDGTESLDAGDIGDAVTAVRIAAPGLPVGVSTGAWIEADPGRRLDLVRSWRVLPDFASVNFSEDGAEALCALLLERGVAVEAGLWHVEATRRFLASDLADRCLRVLIEPMARDAVEALTTAEAVEQALDAAGVETPRLLHGNGQAAWPVLREALRRGLDARVGLEDTGYLPDGQPASGNAALVAAAMALVRGE